MEVMVEKETFRWLSRQEPSCKIRVRTHVIRCPASGYYAVMVKVHCVGQWWLLEFPWQGTLSYAGGGTEGAKIQPYQPRGQQRGRGGKIVGFLSEFLLESSNTGTFLESDRRTLRIAYPIVHPNP